MTVTRPQATGLRSFLGLRFVAVDTEGVRMEMALQPQHLNQGGTLHGGVVTTMIDIACAIAVRAHADGTPPGAHEPVAEPQRPVVTLTLATAFMGTARSGSVTVLAQRRGGGARVHFAAARVLDADGRLLATGDGSYTVRPRMRTAAPCPPQA